MVLAIQCFSRLVWARSRQDSSTNFTWMVLTVRTLIALCFLLLAVYGTAYAQSSAQPADAAAPKAPTAALLSTPASKETPEQIKERGKAWFQQCMTDWDAATHMTKVEWERTCRRVATDRTKFLMGQSR